ncbi:hypothetical protein EDD85DRAFT_957832 [Armillaria nabsnona]|nr:hypothetical protein EDD85DRAFT_957832 [Armillaria nabsnona]
MKHDKDGNYDTEVLTTFHQKLQGLKHLHFQPFDVLEEMHHWVSTNQVDRIAVMAILMWPTMIPAYNKSQSLKSAWTAFINTTISMTCAALLFWYPEPGNTVAKWQPLWDQVMKTPLPKDYILYQIHLIGVERDAETNIDQCNKTVYIENGFVQGLAEGSAPGTDQDGELLVTDMWGIQHVFPIIATHQYPIPEDTYTLIRHDFIHHPW